MKNVENLRSQVQLGNSSNMSGVRWQVSVELVEVPESCVGHHGCKKKKEEIPVYVGFFHQLDCLQHLNYQLKLRAALITHQQSCQLFLGFYLYLAMATNENLPPNVIKQLAKELKNLDETPPEGIKVGVNDDDFSTIFADIEGPAGTPYENGVFRMKLILTHDFPHSPPKGYFLTKIFHPNIASNGEICVNALKKDWSPSLGLRHVLMVVRCLLIEPFPESALNEQAGKMLLDNYDEYARHARLYTSIHAKPKTKLKTGAISESTTALNVGQTHTSLYNVDQKSVVSGVTPLQQPSPLAPTANIVKGGNSLDQPLTVDTAVSGSAAPPSLTMKKEAGLAKLPADKKKIDARKKSLKRL